MSRIIRVAAAQSGPIQKAESRQAVVKRLCDLLDQAHEKGVNFVVFTELALTTFFPRWYMALPRKLRFSSIASQRPRPSLKTVVIAV